jgi:hypothetical protein
VRRSFAHSTAKPVLRMPPGYSVVAVAEHRQREMASSDGGWSP